MNTKELFERFDAALAEQTGSRRDAVRNLGKAGVVLGAAGVPALFAALLRPGMIRAQQQQQPSVTEVLNFALTLEFLEAEFYNIGVATPGLIPAEDRRIFRIIRDHENAHVAFLLDALGAAAVPKPTFDFTAGGVFPDVFTNYATFRTLSQGFEDTGVRAYKGQAPNLINNDAVLTAALTIHSVEARHASEVRRLNGNFESIEPQQGWITNANPGVVPATVNGIPVGNAIYGPGTPPEQFPSEANTTHGGVNVATLQYDVPIEAGSFTESFDEPLDMATVRAIASLFIVGA